MTYKIIEECKNINIKENINKKLVSIIIIMEATIDE